MNVMRQEIDDRLDKSIPFAAFQDFFIHHYCG